MQAIAALEPYLRWTDTAFPPSDDESLLSDDNSAAGPHEPSSEAARPRARTPARPDILQRNWAPGTRAVAAGAGAALVGAAVVQRNRAGAGLAAAGLIAVVSGGLNLATANGGPGTGNGVVGGATAFVLGLIAMAIGGLALARCRRTALEPGRMT